MRHAALFLLIALPLAACNQGDPQRTQAYQEMTGHAAAPDAAAAAHGEVATSPADQYTAETVAQYDAASQSPQPNLNMQAMRGMPIPDTATRGWASVGRSHRQHAEGGHEATPQGNVPPPKAGADPTGTDPSGTGNQH